jgi:hypothetical protein
LQVFDTDVVKVDWDVAYVVMVCTRMLQASVPNVSSVFSDVCCKCLSRCYICFTHMLKCFVWMLRMFAIVFKYFCKCFICFLLYTVSIAFRCFKSRSGVAHRMCVGRGEGASGPARARDASDVQAVQAPHGHRRATSEQHVPSRGRVKRGVETDCGHGRPSRHIRALTVPLFY